MPVRCRLPPRSKRPSPRTDAVRSSRPEVVEVGNGGQRTLARRRSSQRVQRTASSPASRLGEVPERGEILSGNRVADTPKSQQVSVPARKPPARADDFCREASLRSGDGPACRQCRPSPPASVEQRCLLPGSDGCRSRDSDAGAKSPLPTASRTGPCPPRTERKPNQLTGRNGSVRSQLLRPDRCPCRAKPVNRPAVGLYRVSREPGPRATRCQRTAQCGCPAAGVQIAARAGGS